MVSPSARLPQPHTKRLLLLFCGSKMSAGRSLLYVERRGKLRASPPLGSAGKRAAFGAFFAPLHFLTVRRVAQELDGSTRGGSGPETILDLGCGTGAAGAAWALHAVQGGRPQPPLNGYDLHPWAVDEARWTYRALGLHGRALEGQVVAEAEGEGLLEGEGAQAGRGRCIPLRLRRRGSLLGPGGGHRKDREDGPGPGRARRTTDGLHRSRAPFRHARQHDGPNEATGRAGTSTADQSSAVHRRRR